MTAPQRAPLARASDASAISSTWDKAVDIRREWLGIGLATTPADRAATEEALSRVYARLHRPRPDFVWADSPRAAAAMVSGVPNHQELYRWVHGRPPPGRPPLASDLAAGLSRLRSALDGRIEPPAFDRPPPKRDKGQAWPKLPPAEAPRYGVPLPEVLRQGVREALYTSLSSLYLPVRATALHNGPVCWYGQQEAWWIAYYDVWRRLGLADYRRADGDHLDDWAELARRSGWWWPGERVCVVSDRPASVLTEPLPRAWYEQVRVSTVAFRDGWTVHCGQ
jgi:hypothetical protein